MALGLVQYAIGRHRLPEESKQVPNPLPKARIPKLLAVAVLGLVGIGASFWTGLVNAANLATVVLILSLIAAVAYFVVILVNRRLSPDERSRVVAFIPMFLASAAFWSLYQQQFTVITVYSDQRLDRSLFGWLMPISWVQSINPILIIILSGVFAAMWTKLGARQPSTPVKFGLGLTFIGLSFLLFIPLAGGGPSSTPLLALVGILLAFTISELLLSPVGLSLATKLAPTIFKTQLVALNFLSIAAGTALSGIFAGYYTPQTERAYFSISGGAAVALGLLLLALTRPLRTLMRGVR